MSVQAMAWAFRVRGISSSEKLVLLSLGNYADEMGRCWPRQETIAEETELSARTVWGAMKSLEEKGFLVREERKRSDGTRRSDFIILSLHSPDDQAANPAKPTRKSRETNSQQLRRSLRLNRQGNHQQNRQRLRSTARPRKPS